TSRYTTALAGSPRSAPCRSMSASCPLTLPCACTGAAAQSAIAKAVTVRTTHHARRESELKADPEADLPDVASDSRVVLRRHATILEADEEGLRRPPQEVRLTHRVARTDGPIGQVHDVEA